jgi:hypothetical protein
MRLHNAKMFARRIDKFLYSFKGLPNFIYPKTSVFTHYCEDSFERVVLMAALMPERSIGIFSPFSFLLTTSISSIIALYCAKK